MATTGQTDEWATINIPLRAGMVTATRDETGQLFLSVQLRPGLRLTATLTAKQEEEYATLLARI